MHFPSFTEEDFKVFNIAGLENRMEGLKRTIRPKFEIIGEQISPFLTMLMQEPVFVHIAKHARRTVNPPEDTWVAWSTNKRGYKAHPHFQLGLRDIHVFICFAIIYECEKKVPFARNLREQLDEVWPAIPDHFYISQDHTKPDVISKQAMDHHQVTNMLDRLEKVKKSEFVCGILIPRETATNQSSTTLLQQIEDTFEKLYPLYKLASS